MNNNINILIVEPGKAPRPAVTANTLEAAERLLGGAVQVGCFLPPNRCIPHGNGYISGTFLLCGIPEEGCNFASLTPEQQKEFQDMFAQPGEFMLVGGTAYANPDNVVDMVYGLHHAGW